MVHRPADSRLLTNLLSHEKDYSKHLSILLDYSQASLASFSAYASASAPPASQVVLAVAGALANADDALRKYAASLERWQAQLKALKDLEDEVGNIMRDREILVTRLIKVSKQRPARDGILGASGSTSSLSFSKSDPQNISKLTTAQTELQACEAHLAMKERELDSLRTSAIKVGLQGRCSAMVECGWTWGEMGKEGLRALEAFGVPNGNGIHQHPYASAAAYKPLPDIGSDSGHPPSDLSTLAPSQSASQVALAYAAPPHADADLSPPNAPLAVPTAPRPYTLSIPPAHAITDIAMPNGLASERIPEEEDGDGGSSVGEDEGQLEVHENSGFRANGKRHDSPVSGLRHPHFSIRGSLDSASEPERHHRLKSPPPRERHRSLFGKTMAALFHRDKEKDKDKSDGGSMDGNSPTKASSSAWYTRTDRHLTKTKGGDDSSDEDGAAPSHHYATWSPFASLPAPVSPKTAVTPSLSDGLNNAQRLKKTKRSSSQPRPAPRVSDADKGRMSDGATVTGSKAQGAAQLKKPVIDGATKMNGNARPSPSMPQNLGTVRAQKSTPSGNATGSALENKPSLSRNSSLSKQSVVSAPLSGSPLSGVAPLQRSSSTSTATRRRTTSIEISESAKSGPKGNRRPLSASQRSGLTRTNEPSLMSIVEGVSRQNREAWLRQDPNRMLVVPKAPAPINFEHIMGAQITSTQSASHLAAPERHDMHARDAPRNPALVPASASAPSLPATPHGVNRPLPKSPLRSALRTSRSPSPKSPPPVAGPSLSGIFDAVAPPKVDSTLAEDAENDEAASVSSYETGREEFDDDPEPPSADPPPPPPPPHDDKPMVGGSDLSHSDSTATTATPPVHRKSVRMSLPPTFSTTPPAIEDDDDNTGTLRGRPQPRASSTRDNDVHQSRWKSRIEEPHHADVWQDSSSEDEEYRSAKRLLRRLSRRSVV
ncbi:hypothetical protein BKA93DRAFT_773426 [Sparassis latifolia]